MRATITEIGRTKTVVWGAAFYVCGNDEVLAERTISEHDPSGNGWSDESAEAIRAAINILTDAGYDYEQVTDFRAYSGGPRKRLVEPVYFLADLSGMDPADIEAECFDWKATWQSGAGATPIPGDVGAKDVERIADQAEDALSSVMKELCVRDD